MQQLAYKNKLFISGKFPEVILHLKELSLQFNSLREYLDSKTRGL